MVKVKSQLKISYEMNDFLLLCIYTDRCVNRCPEKMNEMLHVNLTGAHGRIWENWSFLSLSLYLSAFLASFQRPSAVG